ncbi:hypothetical protein SAMN05216490_2094 [Mucilaginibacter mallensis]|uniref:Uncharacterized protein n=1 Tax=Mucilaginibacter mallensis TaxID=652787 RepID=A0A1H1W418_MUCMA|nr:hypothetical protein SAMN05216490_2094 [Mucilaginibacter mallensis]
MISNLSNKQNFYAVPAKLQLRKSSHVAVLLSNIASHIVDYVYHYQLSLLVK